MSASILAGLFTPTWRMLQSKSPTMTSTIDSLANGRPTRLPFHLTIIRDYLTAWRPSVNRKSHYVSSWHPAATFCKFSFSFVVVSSLNRPSSLTSANRRPEKVMEHQLSQEPCFNNLMRRTLPSFSVGKLSCPRSYK